MSKLPSPQGKNRAYELLLKREARIKPASVSYRHELLRKIKRSNYINEYDRIQGELDSLANVFGMEALRTPMLHKRQQELKQLFHETHNEPKHPIYIK